MNRLIWNLLRRVAFWIIKKTNTPWEVPYVVFRHKCDSESVIALGRFPPKWKEGAFECLECGVLTNTGIEARMVDPEDVAIRAKRKAGLTVVYCIF